MLLKQSKKPLTTQNLLSEFANKMFRMLSHVYICYYYFCLFEKNIQYNLFEAWNNHHKVGREQTTSRKAEN